MSQLWYYPTEAAATTTLTFNIAAHLISDSPSIEFNQAVERSKGGTMFSESFGAAKRIYPFTAYVHYSHASNLDYDDICTFLITTINGAENTFQWKDEESVTRTVRIVDGTINFEMAGNYRKFTCNLEVQ